MRNRGEHPRGSLRVAVVTVTTRIGILSDLRPLIALRTPPPHSLRITGKCYEELHFLLKFVLY